MREPSFKTLTLPSHFDTRTQRQIRAGSAASSFSAARRPKVYMQLLGQSGRFRFAELGCEVMNQIILSSLTKSEAVDSERSPQVAEKLELAAKRQGEDMAFDRRPIFDGIDPVRDELAIPSRSIAARKLEAR